MKPLIKEQNPCEVVNMELLRVKKNFQITLSQGLRAKLNLHEGDYMQADVEDGAIVIRPVEVVSDTKKDKKAAFALLDQIWEKTKNEEPEAVEKLVSATVKAVRK